MSSNAPYSDQRKFNANANANVNNIVGISNSPFTDQRKEQGGGGEDDGTGNMQYDLATESINTRLGGINSKITTIDQGADTFNIGNDAGSLEFNQNNNVELIGDADVTILASEIGRFRAEKNVQLLSGFLNNVFENSIDMTIDQQDSKIILKSEGDSDENVIQLLTVSNGSAGVAGGCSFTMVSDNVATNSDRITLNVSSLVENQQWLAIRGVDINGVDHTLNFTDTEVVFTQFETFDFAGEGSFFQPTAKNPAFQFSNTTQGIQEYYQFANVPIANQVLSISSGTGDKTDPWQLTWEDPSSGNGSVDFINGTFRNNGTNPTTIIKTFGSTQSRVDFRDQNAQSNPRDEWATIRRNNSAMTFYGGNFGTNTVEPSIELQNINSFSFVGQNGSPNDSIPIAFRKDNIQGNSQANTYFRMFNRPDGISATDVYKLTTQRTSTGTGLVTEPFQMRWILDTAGGSLNSLSIDYVTENSVLVLSDPIDGIISTTTIVGGRTVLIEDVIVNGTTELSALGLSNTIFPPPLEGQTGYFAGLIGNSPPRVSLNPTTGLTNWFPGASFKITLAGEITKIGGYDDIRLKVYSNRGQPSENILNSFSMITRSVQPPPSVGWNWVIDFTCRKVNDGNILGVISTSSAFNYTDDSYILENLGAIVSNTNSSFDTSVEQFLDCTIEFDYYNNSNNIKTTLCTIERIF
jgi:hypothetical protein